MKCIKRVIDAFCVYILLAFTLSCQRQKSPDIASEDIKKSTELLRLNACSKVNFNKGVLLYQNALDLFVCTKWNEQFPFMYKAMQEISASSWDHMMAPIDEAFISNHERRDRLFKSIRELDSKNGLDDLSYVIVALNETNFFDSTKAMFSCIDNPKDSNCNARVGRIPEKKSLKNILRLVDTRPETIVSASAFIKLLVKAINIHQEELRFEINKFRTSPLYVPLRLKLVDSLVKKVKEGFSNEDRQLAAKILLTGNKAGNTPWIYQWLQDEKMNRTKFRDLIEYPSLTNPDFVTEIKNLKLAYDSGVSCTIKSTDTNNELIEFDFKTHLSEYVSVIRNKGYKDFYDYSSSDVVALKMSTEICKELERNRYNINFIKLITQLSEFLGEKKFYDLVKFGVSQTTAKGDADKSFSENLYLFDLLAGDVFTSGNELNSNILTSTRNFYPIIFDVLKRIPPEGYVHLGEFLSTLSQKENDEKFKGVADFWSFFSSEEKNFLFNFVDRHFDRNIKYVLLFDFYTKFLDELKDVQPKLQNAWIGSDEKEEMSYLTLQDMFSHLAGRDTLLDFKRFFSRDQIIKVLEVISNGQSINQLAKEELKYFYSDNYILTSKGEKYSFNIKYSTDNNLDYDSKALVGCMKTFAEIQNGLYELVRHLPEACTKISNENIAFRISGWLNSIELDYLSYKKAIDQSDSLLDNKGILSPYMLNATLGTLKRLDNILGPLNSSLPTSKGINYAIDSASFFLNQKNAAPLIDQNLQWINLLMEAIPAKGVQHRNALIKIFTKENNFSNSKNFFSNIGDLLSEYGNWVKSDQLTKAQTRSLGIYDPNQACGKVVNQFAAPYPCPSNEIIKKYGNEIIYLLQNIWDKDLGSPIAMFLKGMKTGEGLDIPLNAKVTHKNRLSLRDSFKYLYDVTDKTWEVNRQKYLFTNEAGITSNEVLTVGEGVEAVIREVRFRNNYLGAAFLNYVVQHDNYNEDVKGRKKVTKACFAIPFIHCGYPMSDDDKRMMVNALNTFDSLLDVNNGLGKDARLQYADYMKTFEQALLGTSPKASQAINLLTPLSQDVLTKHNGKILVDMMMLTFPTNAGRVIRDRVGRTREEFESFINREDFKLVDRAFLYGFNLKTSGAVAERLLRKIQIVPEGEKQNLFGHTVDWINSLSYDEVRLLEDTIARGFVIGSYLGTPDFVFNKSSAPALTEKYANNNLFQVFLAVEKIVDYWPVLKNYFPADVRFIDVLRPLNTAFYFLTTKLTSSNDPINNKAYLAVNDLFLLLQTSLFDQIANPQIGGNPDLSTQGVDLLLELFKDPKLVSNTYAMVKADYKFLDILHENKGETFLSLGQNLKRMGQSSRLDLRPLRDYLSFTSRSSVCLTGDSRCISNYHYDEPASLIQYLNKKSDSGQSNFMLMNQKLFVENHDQITQMLDDLLPSVKLRENNLPPLFN